MMGLGLTKKCKTCDKPLIESGAPGGDMVFLECPDCRIVWDYYYKTGRKKNGL